MHKLILRSACMAVLMLSNVVTQADSIPTEPVHRSLFMMYYQSSVLGARAPMQCAMPAANVGSAFILAVCPTVATVVIHYHPEKVDDAVIVTIRSETNNNICMAVENNQMAVGARIVSKACSGGAEQDWAFAAGAIRPFNARNQYCLEVRGGTSATIGAELVLANCASGFIEKRRQSVYVISPEQVR